MPDRAQQAEPGRLSYITAPRTEGGPSERESCPLPRETTVISRSLEVNSEESTTQPPRNSKRKSLASLLALFCLLCFCAFYFLAKVFIVPLFASLESNVSFTAMILFALTSNILRKLVPQLYFAFPLGTVFLVFLAQSQGPEIGAVIYTLFKCQNVFFFPLLRRYYTGSVDAWLTRQTSTPLQRRLRTCFTYLDAHWKAAAFGKGMVVKSTAVAAWNLSYLMDDMVNLLWLATRSSISWREFTLSYLVSTMAGYPRIWLSMHAWLHWSTLLPMAELDFAIREREVWVGIIAFFCTVPATLLVHGFHVKLLTQAIRRRANKTRASPPISPLRNSSARSWEEPAPDSKLGSGCDSKLAEGVSTRESNLSTLSTAARESNVSTIPIADDTHSFAGGVGAFATVNEDVHVAVVDLHTNRIKRATSGVSELFDTLVVPGEQWADVLSMAGVKYIPSITRRSSVFSILRHGKPWRWLQATMQVDDDERLFFLKDVTDTHKLILQRRRENVNQADRRLSIRTAPATTAARAAGGVEGPWDAPSSPPSPPSLGRMVGSSPRTISASDVNMDDLDWPEGIAPIWPQAPNPLQHKPLKPLQHIPAHNPVQPNPVEKDATVDPDDEAEFVAWSNRPVPATVTSPPADTPDPDEADFAATCWKPVAHPPPRD